ncbi:DNA/RNA helicase domain-containing protein [Streptacidiphilus sp. N1-12]|uniref:DNA/RNA helicase domain-containing protein n=2 Tax=Streptacidiphilus alkalitolerans TaxID=3342712 RepID=A0ABV6VAT9_9ACTN
MAEVALALGKSGFFSRCASRFEHIYGCQPSPEEVQSWRHSWPILLNTLEAAGLNDLYILLEYSLPATGERVDALLLGNHLTGGLGALAIELKQWSHVAIDPDKPGLVTVGGREVSNPARQVGGYVRYLREEIDLLEPPLRTGGVAYLHEAPPATVDMLRQAAARVSGGEYPMVGHEDVARARQANELAAILCCADLRAPLEGQVQALLDAPHRPSRELMARASAVIEDHPAFNLIGAQDTARQQIWYAAKAAERRAQSGRKTIVVVTGGPGTGKTAIACRVLGDLCKRRVGNPKLFIPSGTISHQLQRRLSDKYRSFVRTFTDAVPGGLTSDSVVLVDEAHRIRGGSRGATTTQFPRTLDHLLRKVAVVVLFLDERQVVRPDEGVTLDQLRAYADEQSVELVPVNLDTQFRCNGSPGYVRWIDRLFSDDPAVPTWSGAGYDLGLMENPEELAQWCDLQDARPEQTARITAGFCWPWKSGERVPLLPEVEIPWADSSGQPRLWCRPWNFKGTKGPLGVSDVPGRPFWATDAGGNGQVGCIYTAQGMEYTHSAVILGRDVVRRGDRWVGQPHLSHDDKLNRLSPDHYLHYALNVYRVLATRGSRATRLYSMDGPTQAYLRSLLPPSDRSTS